MAYCKTCGTTDASLFYASIKTYCKEHWKAKVRENRVANIEHYRAFDKLRSSMPHRVAARKEYITTAAGKAAHRRATARWAERYPERREASHAVGNAVRDGKLAKLPCVVCGNLNVEAHHADYSQPLDVMWLCDRHHKEIHWHMKEAA